MTAKPKSRPSQDRRPRRTEFSVKEQLRGKLGPAGLAELMKSLEGAARPRKRRGPAA